LLQQSTSPLTILVVDDDAIIAMNSVDIVESLGHTAIEAHSGEAALAILSARHIDVLITDQSMPGMTGLELAMAARVVRPQLPVVLASGYSEADLKGTELVTLMGKPFDERMLERKLAAAIESRKSVA
jgi:CheY-like chemotaxis protein